MIMSESEILATKCFQVIGNVIIMPTVDSDSKGNDRIRKLYPLVDEEKTPLPRGWNPKDKGQFIGISQNGRRVSYRGGLS